MDFLMLPFENQSWIMLRFGWILDHDRIRDAQFLKSFFAHFNAEERLSDLKLEIKNEWSKVHEREKKERGFTHWKGNFSP